MLILPQKGTKNRHFFCDITEIITETLQNVKNTKQHLNICENEEYCSQGPMSYNNNNNNINNGGDDDDDDNNE